MLDRGFAADVLTNPKSSNRAVTYKEFTKLVRRVTSLEKKVVAKI